jgi:hypothetical protein
MAYHCQKRVQHTAGAWPGRQDGIHCTAPTCRVCRRAYLTSLAAVASHFAATTGVAFAAHQHSFTQLLHIPTPRPVAAQFDRQMCCYCSAKRLKLLSYCWFDFPLNFLQEVCCCVNHFV